MDAKLVVATGPARGREIPLPLTILTIGRSSQCHLRPHCPLVSKLHCAVARWAGKVNVRDLKSANGTFVNGERIEGESRLVDGDVLDVGSFTFTVCITPSPIGPVPSRVLSESDVRWLLTDPANDPALSLSETRIEEIPALKRALALAGGDRESGMSAGEYLRDYLRVWYGSERGADHQRV